MSPHAIRQELFLIMSSRAEPCRTYFREPGTVAAGKCFHCAGGTVTKTFI